LNIKIRSYQGSNDGKTWVEFGYDDINMTIFHFRRQEDFKIKITLVINNWTYSDCQLVKEELKRLDLYES
jgi:hypothetical protein